MTSSSWVLRPPSRPGSARAYLKKPSRREADQAALRKQFDAIRIDAKSLSIPVLGRKQFLEFIGVKVPANAPEDQLAGQ